MKSRVVLQVSSCLLVGLSLQGTASSLAPGRALAAHAVHVPLWFEPNVGQAPPQVLFLARDAGQTLYLLRDGIALSSATGGPLPPRYVTDQRRPINALVRRTRRLNWRTTSLQFLRADRNAQIYGVHRLPGRVNYFIGKDPQRWHVNIPTYAQVRYRSIYPGIDMRFYGTTRGFEYDWIVNPGARPSHIVLSVPSGMTRSGRDGDLALGGGLRQTLPRAYQRMGRQRLPVSIRYRRLGRNQLGLSLSRYDHHLPLIIDPSIEVSTYLGGTDYSEIASLVLDSSGNQYLTGYTSSDDFPHSGGVQPGLNGGQDAIITKLDPTGTSMVYSTYLGGRSFEGGIGIAVDSQGRAFIAGVTESTDFPIQRGFRKTCHGTEQTCVDAFVAAVSPDGSKLLYSTYLGGSGVDIADGIALDGQDDMYVTGETVSTDFPVASPVQKTHGAPCASNYGHPVQCPDAFVTKLSFKTGGIAFSTYLGGTDTDAGTAVAADSSDSVYIAGFTFSKDFPHHHALQSKLGGGDDAFITKLSPAGGWVFSTYFGGKQTDTINALSLDQAGNPVVAGFTDSPGMPRGQGRRGKLLDAFVAKFNADGSGIQYITYLGGSQFDSANAVSVGADGVVAVSGETASDDFPVLNAVQPQRSPGMCAGVAQKEPCSDAFVTELDGNTGAVTMSTYLGGADADGAAAAAIDSDGAIHVAGDTYSWNFPSVNSLDGKARGVAEGFLSVIDPSDTRMVNGAVKRPVVSFSLSAPYPATYGQSGLKRVSNLKVKTTGMLAIPVTVQKGDAGLPIRSSFTVLQGRTMTTTGGYVHMALTRPERTYLVTGLVNLNETGRDTIHAFVTVNGQTREKSAPLTVVSNTPATPTVSFSRLVTVRCANGTRGGGCALAGQFRPGETATVYGEYAVHHVTGKLQVVVSLTQSYIYCAGNRCTKGTSPYTDSWTIGKGRHAFLRPYVIPRTLDRTVNRIQITDSLRLGRQKAHTRTVSVSIIP